jgi:peptidoglycan glycosyltransferase
MSLTLDIRLQRQAYHLLGNRRGAVVMMDVQQGDLLVCASKPSFDPHRIDDRLFRGGRGDSVLLSRATHGMYPPGSTLKVLPAIAAVNAGFKGRIECPADGWTTSAKYPRIHDYGYYAAQKNDTYWGGYGAIDLPTAMAKSSNIFFARLGVQLGIDALHETAEGLYFNRRIPLHRSLGGKWDAPGGSFPKLSARDQYGLAQVSIGQGKVLTTPLHMALLTAAIANQGVAPQPRLSLEQKPANLATLMSPNTAGQVGAMMRKVVTEGTGRRINRSEFSVAGKTGTADHGGTAPHAWFIAFAPYEAPRLAIAVLIEDGGFGSTEALPIADKLFEQAKGLGYLEISL